IPTTEKDLSAKGGWVFFIWDALEAGGYTIRLRRNDMRFSKWNQEPDVGSKRHRKNNEKPCYGRH
ncbi:hypothetical protein KAU19_07275, partial [Candidatus Parcubacteria bacterium]|nr:hypothetical protein [Candidatus Parcubacteria bacterium]